MRLGKGVERSETLMEEEAPMVAEREAEELLEWSGQFQLQVSTEFFGI